MYSSVDLEKDVSDIKFILDPIVYNVRPTMCGLDHCTVMLDPQNRREVKAHVMEHTKTLKAWYMDGLGENLYRCNWRHGIRPYAIGGCCNNQPSYPLENLFRHITILHLPLARKYTCPLCAFTSEFRKDCKDHLIDRHGATRFKKLRNDPNKPRYASESSVTPGPE